MIAIDVSKQETLSADSKAIHKLIFITEEARETI